MSAETIPGLLAQRAAEHPEREAIVDDAARLNYAELDRRSAERATWLVAQGVNKGHRIALSMPNSVEWAINAYAVLRIGAILVPLSTLLRAPELHAQLAVAGVRHLIAAPAFRDRNYRQEIGTIDRCTLPFLCNIFWTDELGDGGSPQHGVVASALAERVQPANVMVIIFTSGSCGAPKGVIHTHGNALRATAAGLADRCVRGGTRVYLPMPFFWVGGFAAGLISALVAGATLLTEAMPEPKRTLNFLERERATLFRGWPDQAAALASHPNFLRTDLSTLIPGSLDALLPPALRGPSGSRARLFGMTESFGPFCGYPLDEDMPQDKWGSCGRPFPGIDVRIVDPDSGAPLPNNQTGAIQIGGRNILQGICGREREDVFTPDGWYDCGDMGKLDAEGFLYFVGRRDDMVKIKGATVYPSEVESVLEAIPGIRLAFATDITIDGVMAMGAMVVTDTVHLADDGTLQCAARERLSAFKVPSRWLVVTSLQDVPRMTSGKIDKVALRELLQSSKASSFP